MERQVNNNSNFITVYSIKYLQAQETKVNFYLDVGELTSRTLAKRLSTLANRPKTLANETLAKQLVKRNEWIPFSEANSVGDRGRELIGCKTGNVT